MKWSELLPSLFGKGLDEDVDNKSLQALGISTSSIYDKDKVVNINLGSKKEEIAVKNKTEEGEKMLDLVYDDKSGLFDLSNIEDKRIKSILSRANNNVIKKDSEYKINLAFNSKIKSVKLRDGINEEAVKKLLKLDDVAVNENGEVVGLDKAFEDLKASQPGMFISNDTDKKSSPLLEGFSPAGASGYDGNGVDMALAQLANSMVTE